MNILLLVIFFLHLPILASDHSKLTYDEVMTFKWERLASASQYQKDRALMNAIRMPNPYNDQRKYIAAAIYAGASVPIAQLKTSSESPFKLLPNATLMQDVPLVRLLLAHGADIDERGFADLPAIYFAQNPAIAQELINNGAWEILSQEEKNELLFHTMRAGFSADLIALYRQQGLSPMLCDREYWTPLMHLAARPEQDTIAKAAALLKDLSHKQIVQFINFKALNSNENVFNVITTTKKLCNRYELAELKALRAFLEQELHQDTCTICFDLLDNRTCAHVNDYKLHTTCYAWAQQTAWSTRSK